jgi:hypothetical protein
VAALTMPALVAKHQEKVTVTKLKKAYSVLSQAFVEAIDEYGPVKDWGYYEADGNPTLSSGDKILDNLAPYLNLAKKCTYQESGSDCLPISDNKLLNGKTWGVGRRPTAMLADGTVFFINPDNASGGGWIGIITNDKPMQAGVNTFLIRYSSGAFYRLGVGMEATKVLKTVAAIKQPTPGGAARHGCSITKTWTTCTATIYRGVARINAIRICPFLSGF